VCHDRRPQPVSREITNVHSRFWNSYFSPLHIVIGQLFYPDHPLLAPLILAITTAHLTFLISQYQWLVKDRMTLNAEVMREYDQGFVYKKLFATRMDKSVQTNEGEFCVERLWLWCE
jgi:hypothetical protein